MMNSMPKFIIVTGLSGAGKSQVADSFEDLNFFCVDNLPLELIPKFAELCIASDGAISRAAIVLDVRGRFQFERLFQLLTELKQQSVDFEILFLDANDTVLLKRFQETRRRHPLGNDYVLIDAIREERRQLLVVREKSNIVIDTSSYSPWQLKEKIASIYNTGSNRRHMVINLTSFGYKYGVPVDADLVFDLRFLPNPHYVDELRPLTGKDRRIVDYVMDSKTSKAFKRRLFGFINFLVPEYITEGKSHLKIAIGCTGGKHRSVAFTEMLFKDLKKKDYKIIVKHRDMPT
jgi:UPF0042 nucleotide-binding protein